MAKRKRKKQHKPEFEFYTFEIRDWSWSFHFSVDKRTWAEGPYYDMRPISIVGSIIEPEAFTDLEADVTVMPRAIEEDADSRDVVPSSIGYIEKYPEHLRAYVTIPGDALPSMLAALSAGAVRFVTLVATRMRYRKALVTSFGLVKEIDDE
jgi:hypothetical protein